MEELKPCPFCGNSAGIYRRFNIFQEQVGYTIDSGMKLGNPAYKTMINHTYYVVACGNSLCSVAPEVSSACLEKAIERWNKRYEPERKEE